MRIARRRSCRPEQADRARLAESPPGGGADPHGHQEALLHEGERHRPGPEEHHVRSGGDIVVDVPDEHPESSAEIPTYMPAVLQLLDHLDTATPQVMIEARIVEDHESLGRSLGINWGVNPASADEAPETRPGLAVSPRTRSTGRFNVPLATGTPIGPCASPLPEILQPRHPPSRPRRTRACSRSSPRQTVAALTNTAARIQSGVQIPFSTNVNNTTTYLRRRGRLAV
jgi:hypothetical protein